MAPGEFANSIKERGELAPEALLVLASKYSRVRSIKLKSPPVAQLKRCVYYITFRWLISST